MQSTLCDIRIGDCREIIPVLDAESIDACVTDPPYGLTANKKGGSGIRSLNENSPAGRARIGTGFMGKAWDGSGVELDAATWGQVLRVLKPGAYLLAFGGTRTVHRIACAIEDAGFEIRDTICWLYGQGFPKSHNLEGEWDGWGTALKPAHEPIIVARKPFPGTVAANVARHGTGAINVDGCRIAAEPGRDMHGNRGIVGGRYASHENGEPVPHTTTDRGRWPANVVLDEDAAAALDAMSGERPVSGSARNGRPAIGTAYDATKIVYGSGVGARQGRLHNDTGGASRFFYCAKASRSERNAGLDGLPEAEVAQRYGLTAGGSTPQQTPHLHQPQANHHPTVKPVALMRWLVRLVTPPGGTILDPFTGSGSTGIACILEGFRFIGCETDAEYADIARRRIAHAAGPLFAVTA